MLYFSGSGHAPGEICPITVQNSTQAKDRLLPRGGCHAMPGQSDESNELLRLQSFIGLAHQTKANITKERQNSIILQGEGSGVIMKSDKGNCFIVID